MFPVYLFFYHPVMGMILVEYQSYSIFLIIRQSGAKIKAKWQITQKVTKMNYMIQSYLIFFISRQSGTKIKAK